MTKSGMTAVTKRRGREFKQGLHNVAGKGAVVLGNTDAADRKKTLILLLVSPLKGFFYVLTFPVIAIATVARGAWLKRKEKQILLEREHSKVVAFLLSFVEGLLYVAVFPLIVIGTLIKKLTLELMEEQGHRA